MIAPQPCFEARGTPMNVEMMCRTLTEEGYEVHLATYPHGKHIEMPGLVYHRVSRVPGIYRVSIGFSPAKVLYDLLLTWMTLRLLLKHRFCVIHAVEEMAFVAAPLGWLFGAHVIIDMDSDICHELRDHETLFTRILSRLTRPMQRYALRHCDCAITVCQALTTLVSKLCPGKPVFQVEDIPMPSAHRTPDPDRVEAMRREFGLQGRQTVVYVGNLASYQGVEMLVDAAAHVCRERPHTSFLIIGGEEGERQSLEARARDAGLEQSVRFVGPCAPEDVPDYLALADVFASPRRAGQNTPLKIYTYMLSGKPIVATRMAAHTQVLDERCAILTGMSAGDFANGLIHVLDHPDESIRLAAVAREHVLQYHTYAHFKNRLSLAYRFVTAPVPARKA